MKLYIVRDEKLNLIDFSDSKDVSSWHLAPIHLKGRISMIAEVNELQQLVYKNFTKVHPLSLINHYLTQAKISTSDKAFSFISKLARLRTDDCRIPYPSEKKTKITSYADVERHKSAERCAKNIWEINSYTKKIIDFVFCVKETEATFKELKEHIELEHKSVNFKFTKDKNGLEINWDYLEKIYQYDSVNRPELEKWHKYIQTSGWSNNLFEINKFAHSYKAVKHIPKLEGMAAAYILLSCNPKFKSLHFLVGEDNELAQSWDASKINYVILDKKEAGSFVREEMFYNSIDERMFVATYKKGELMELEYLNGDYGDGHSIYDEKGIRISERDYQQSLSIEMNALLLKAKIDDAMPVKVEMSKGAKSADDKTNKI